MQRSVRPVVAADFVDVPSRVNHRLAPTRNDRLHHHPLENATGAYPLKWPEGWPRTPLRDRTIGKHRLWRLPVNGRRESWSFAHVRAGLMKELEQSGATDILITSDFRVDSHGHPHSDARRPLDQGVAVYFELDGLPMVIAHDPYIEIEANMRSLALAIAALRAVEAHGGRTIMHKALVGFAVPASVRSTAR